MQLFMLDTNTISYIFNGKSLAARSHLDSLPPTHAACISTVTEAELRYGMAKSSSDRRRKMFGELIQRMPIIPWDSDAAKTYGKLRAELERSGRILGPLDLQIAAHAISLGATLVTRDRAFRQVSDLPGLENWATDL